MIEVADPIMMPSEQSQSKIRRKDERSAASNFFKVYESNWSERAGAICLVKGLFGRILL
jgi:hypothetical protein